MICMAARKTENWLLVEWSGGGRDVIYVKSVLSPLNKELKVGDILTANRRGEAHAGTLIARARERYILDAKTKSEEPQPAGPSVKNDEDPEDFSSSASSWEPSDDGAMSADSDTVEAKKIKLDKCKRQYSNRRSSKKVLTPMNKVTAIIPKSMQQSNSLNRKRSFKETRKQTPVNKSQADSTKKHNGAKAETNLEKVTIDVRELMDIRNSFNELFKMIDDLKRAVVPNYMPKEKKIDEIPVDNATDAYTFEETVEEYKDVDNNDSGEFDRSDDNVLITNKYDNQRETQVKQTEKKNGDNEWVPIGSGKTLIHADQFKKVNWRSYTIATRTLLLAVFPRRILATHSLTGKRSPAFQDKPAKMCLDPKIISDVIMEIMDRFDVKENLVRSIITTKCADECKMWKARVNKKKSRTIKDQENVPPETKAN